MRCLWRGASKQGLRKVENVDLNSWEQFTAHIATMRREADTLRAKLSGVYVPDFLFRGQAESTWPLQTTLERYRVDKTTLHHYYSSMWRVKPQIEAHTGAKWFLKLLPPEYLELVTNSDAEFTLRNDFPGYDYMAYMRHHGFPSPLLDWSRSIYVAAFFAFREAPVDGRVAMFVYRETAGGGKGGMVGEPEICVRGPYVSTHKRHFLQQCQYTFCMQWDAKQWSYAAHEAVFAGRRAAREDQDQLWKFTLPTSERVKVLKYLDEHNLNAYSLLGSEESLMEMLAARELR
jgi:hypothetical protein